MQFTSANIAGLVGSYSLGQGVEIPETLLPVLEIPQPLLSNMPGVGLNLINVVGSGIVHIVINQGASSGPTSTYMMDFDRGLYRLTGRLLSTNFVGPAPSSASIRCARIALYGQNQTTAVDLAFTPLEASVPHEDSFDMVFHFPRTMGCYLECIATGVGQSIGVEATLYARKLL